MAHKDGIFLMNCWYVAAWSHDLIDGKKMARTILELPLVLYRGESGRIVALDNRCCHRAAPLDMGRIEGDCLRCMYHGMKFEPSGKCIEIPGQERIPPKLGVRSYPVVERDGIIWIWMGDAELADPADIVDFPALRDPKWRGIPDYMHYDANWMLIVDNLSDFAHLAFVHTNTLGGSEEYAYTTKPAAIERLDDGFRVERWHMDSDSPPYHRKVIPNKLDKVDRKNIGHMKIPGMFYLYTTFSPAGSGLKEGKQEGARRYCNCQFMTPETRRSTHFFWNYLHDFDLQDPNIAISLRNSIEEGFYEDKGFIEGQQKLLDADPDFKMLAIAADAPLSHFRWAFAEALKAEQNAALQKEAAVA